MQINLLADVPEFSDSEVVETLLETEFIRIERIVSHGHASPADFWYDQAHNEWVTLLRGAARLQFEDETLEMRPGDWLEIPAHTLHRVDWTHPAEATVWLAVRHKAATAS